MDDQEMTDTLIHIDALQRLSLLPTLDWQKKRGG